MASTVNPGYMLLADTLESFGNFSLLTATNFPTGMGGESGSTGSSTSTGSSSPPTDQNWNAFGTIDTRQTVGRVQAQLAW